MVNRSPTGVDALDLKWASFDSCCDSTQEGMIYMFASSSLFLLLVSVLYIKQYYRRIPSVILGLFTFMRFTFAVICGIYLVISALESDARSVHLILCIIGVGYVFVFNLPRDFYLMVHHLLGFPFGPLIERFCRLLVVLPIPLGVICTSMFVAIKLSYDSCPPWVLPSSSVTWLFYLSAYPILVLQRKSILTKGVFQRILIAEVVAGLSMLAFTALLVLMASIREAGSANDPNQRQRSPVTILCSGMLSLITCFAMESGSLEFLEVRKEQRALLDHYLLAASDFHGDNGLMD